MAKSTKKKNQSETQLSTAEVQTTTDSFSTMVQDVVSQVCSSSNVRSVFGEPIVRDDVTVIPVASVFAGFGAGFGMGSGVKPKPEAGKGGGMGVGGGFIMQPWGVWEISSNSVRFRRAEAQSSLASLLDIVVALARRRLARSSG